MARVEALTTGQLLDRVFSLYTKNFPLFFSISAIPQLISLVFAAVPTLAIGFGLAVPGTTTAIVLAVVSLLVGLVVQVLALGVSQGAATVAVSDLYLGQPTSVGKCYRQTMPLIWRLMGLSLGYGLLVVLGFFLLIVPGVYWAITYALATAVMAIERVSFSEAMSRGSDLVKGNRGRIALIFLLSLVLKFVIAYGLTIPTLMLSLLIAKTHPTMAQLMNLFVSTLAGALSSPIGLIGFTLAYYDARVRKEAFDLEYMMQTDALASAPIQASVPSTVLEAPAPAAPLPEAPAEVPTPEAAAPDANAAGGGQ